MFPVHRIGAIVLAVGAAAAAAQQSMPTQHVPPATVAAEDTPPPNLYTLHVYANLMQFAVVAMHGDSTPLRHLKPQDFSITLDGGPVFHPTKLKLAADDPLSIALYVDASGAQTTLVHAAADALAHLVPTSLHAQDHVSVYAQDCAVVRTLLDMPAASAETLHAAVDRALTAPTLHGGKNRPACRNQLHLLDGLAFAAGELAQRPGRRVLVVLSQGFDEGSKTSFAPLVQAISRQAISVFGLRDQPDFRALASLRSASMPGREGSAASIGTPPPDLLTSLCRSTGGLLLDANGRTAADKMKQLVRILRDRYIVEFPRPDDREAGMHIIHIEVPDFTAIVLSASASVPIADASLANDPTVLPSTPSPAVLGHKHRN